MKKEKAIVSAMNAIMTVDTTKTIDEVGEEALAAVDKMAEYIDFEEPQSTRDRMAWEMYKTMFIGNPDQDVDNRMRAAYIHVDAFLQSEKDKKEK